MHRTAWSAAAGVAAVLLSLLGLRPQDRPAPATPAERPAANPDDVGSIDAILAALYASHSGPPGQARDFARLRTLFAEGARLLPTQVRGEQAAVRALSIDDYVRLTGERLAEIGFREVEIARRVDRFGAIAHAWSTYASFRGEEKEPFQRGINSIQLVHDGKRWWVQGVLWLNESAQHPIPAEYLPAEPARK